MVNTWLRQFRVHQWSKNVLIFVPLIVSQAFGEVDNYLRAVIAFLALGMCASAMYVLNDLLDLEADRAHPIRRNRPLASGAIAVRNAIPAAIVLLLAGVILAVALLDTPAVVWLMVYLFLSGVYSVSLKNYQSIDVFTLASLFTIRVIIGSAAIGISPSFWLLGFSMFLFHSLALVKRVSELIPLQGDRQSAGMESGARGYTVADIGILQALGVSSGLLSVMVFALYINSAEVYQVYRMPEALWLIIPVLGYWTMRIWVLTARGQMNEDPIVFALTDRNSWIALVAISIVLVIASSSWRLPLI